MAQITDFVVQYGLPLIFLLVLVEQLGAPIPALPVLVVAGALSVDQDLSALAVIGVSLVASWIADTLWFVLGRRRGPKILKTLCRISLSPDACVRQTENLFQRWGMPALLIAKFIPGFSTVAPPLAGAIGVGAFRFLVFDTAGTLLWAGSAVLAGAVFHHAVDGVLGWLDAIGNRALLVLASALIIFIAIKWYERRRFYRFLRMARITVDELRRMREDGTAPMIFDVRGLTDRTADPERIAGAIVLDMDDIDAGLKDVPREREIILYCT